MLIMDYESKLYVDAARKLLPVWSPDDLHLAERYLRERAEMVKAGVVRCPSWFQEELNKIDSRLRCWWDAWKEEWCIDRRQDEGIVEGLLRLSQDESDEYKKSIRDSATGLLENGRYYLTVLHFKPKDEFQLNDKLLASLRQMDMQRYSPAEYMKQKEAAADAKAKSNDNAATDKVLAAVDELSDKQVHEFLEVSRALGTGETITCHGEAEQFMDSIEEARRKAPPIPINKPDVFRPKRKGYK